MTTKKDRKDQADINLPRILRVGNLVSSHVLDTQTGPSQKRTLTKRQRHEPDHQVPVLALLLKARWMEDVLWLFLNSEHSKPEKTYPSHTPIRALGYLTAVHYHNGQSFLMDPDRKHFLPAFLTRRRPSVSSPNWQDLTQLVHQNDWREPPQVLVLNKKLPRSSGSWLTMAEKVPNLFCKTSRK